MSTVCVTPHINIYRNFPLPSICNLRSPARAPEKVSAAPRVQATCPLPLARPWNSPAPRPPVHSRLSLNLSCAHSALALSLSEPP